MKKIENCYLKNPRIFYRKRIIPGKKTIVFVHGIFGTSSSWKKYEEYFMKNYNFISVDLRGHGKSFRPVYTSDYSIENFSEDLYKVISKEKLKNIILVSCSFSNLVSLEFLKKHKKLVNKIIFISFNYSPGNISLSRYFIPIIKYFNKFHFPIKKIGGHIDYGNFKNTYDWDLKRLFIDIKNTGLKSSLNSLISGQEYSGKKIFNSLKIPTLIIHGNKDSIFPVEFTKKMYNNYSKLKVIRNADHMLGLTHFKEVSTSINNFIKD